MAAPALRKLILDLRQKFEQIVDEVSKDDADRRPDRLQPRGTGEGRGARAVLREYLAEHKDEIDALQFFYSVPHKKRLRFKDIQALADAISSPPRQWTPEKLWRAYETLGEVQGARCVGASGC